MIIVNFSGVRIFRIFTVLQVSQCFTVFCFLSFKDSSQFNTTLDQLSQLDTSTRSNKNTSRQSVSRGELMYSLAKSKDEGKEREQKEKDTGNVGAKKEKEKTEIAAQLCGKYLFYLVLQF